MAKVKQILAPKFNCPCCRICSLLFVIPGVSWGVIVGSLRWHHFEIEKWKKLVERLPYGRETQALALCKIKGLCHSDSKQSLSNVGLLPEASPQFMCLLLLDTR